MKPHIDRNTFKSVTIKAGRTLKWSVDVSGEPVPVTSWSWQDNEPDEDTEYIIEDKDYHTDFTITNVQRSDMGKYTLKATNRSGSDEHTVELMVLAPPTVPNGPLDVVNIYNKGCKLKWKKPSDNGGAPLKQYKIEVLDVNCPIPGKWVAAGKVSVGMDEKENVEFDVTGLKPGFEYKFRVTAITDEGESPSLLTDLPIKTPSKEGIHVAVETHLTKGNIFSLNLKSEHFLGKILNSQIMKYNF